MIEMYYMTDRKGRICPSCKDGILITYGRARRRVLCSHCGYTMQRFSHEVYKEKKDESSR